MLDLKPNSNLYKLYHFKAIDFTLFRLQLLNAVGQDKDYKIYFE